MAVGARGPVSVVVGDGVGARVEVWWADLTQAELSLAERLPPAERDRALAPERPADRGRRLVGAALLQHAIAAARADRPGSPPPAPTDPAPTPTDTWFEVDRTCEECGEQHGRPVVAGGPHLSVAHAGVLVVVATCWDAPIGVDVERVDRFADRSDPLATALAWTRAEAAVKAGLASDVAVEAAHGPRPDIFVTLEPAMAGYAATLAAG